ncbi:hypothetical protein L207DRAFT_589478 [Hyaloscypha variabilis F]|uniref:DUF6594 domain-containing protein n=1 Tax=Hyaloscypha variabilis (strain UAMH 11265 / GT02V1 / F) TaxID=1149755 RepID=A0A2J6R5X6_HYAVF|nr:hypothetical protein L207DRAFT_589478 [Hyaloscypha variabilis F]
MGMLKGYPTFSAFIARDQDAAIYRKYESLSARNLLYMSSEIHELEGQLKALDEADFKSACFVAEGAARKWEHYSTGEHPKIQEHRELQARIRVKLKEYHEALLLESQVLELKKPTQRTFKNVKRWFQNGGQMVLLGRDAHLFDNEDDMVALAPLDDDRLSRLLRAVLGWFFEDTESRARRVEHGEELYYFPERKIQRIGLVMSILLSAILLIGAISCLYMIANKSKSLILGMIVLFTCLFACVVGLLTNARRAEVFGSTAAYAAVLVVFVSNPPGIG